jgi:hypothetical protein
MGRCQVVGNRDTYNRIFPGDDPMPRPAKKAARPPARKALRLRQAAKQVVVDAEHVRQDLGRLLVSLEDLSVEALKEVSDRALELIAERTVVEKRSMIGAVIGGAVSVGESVAGLFTRSAPAPKRRRARKAST